MNNKLLLLAIGLAIAAVLIWKYRQGTLVVPQIGATAALQNGLAIQGGSVNDFPDQSIQDLQDASYDDAQYNDVSHSNSSEMPKMRPVENHSFNEPPEADLDGSDDAEENHMFSAQSHGMVGHL